MLNPPGPPLSFLGFDQVLLTLVRNSNSCIVLPLLPKAYDPRRFSKGMSRFDQRLDVPQHGQPLLGDEHLVVGTAADKTREEVPHSVNPVPHLVLRAQAQQLNQLGHGVHGFTSFGAVSLMVRGARGTGQLVGAGGRG